MDEIFHKITFEAVLSGEWENRGYSGLAAEAVSEFLYVSLSQHYKLQTKAILHHAKLLFSPLFFSSVKGILKLEIYF